MSQRLSSASSASLFLLVVLSALVAPSLSKILLDYRIPPTAKVTDMGDKTTALGKLTKATITGKNSLTEAYQFMKVPKSQFQVVALKINDNSIFKDQLGFRRNDIVPEYNAKLFETGTKTYHHSFIFTKGGKLDLKHGYLLASVEFPDAVSTHMFDIFHGTQFDSKNTAGTADKDANKIRVRDINFKTLFDVDVKSDVIFNFAIEVDVSCPAHLQGMNLSTRKLRGRSIDFHFVPFYFRWQWKAKYVFSKKSAIILRRRKALKFILP
ncbi:hypothetical protein PGT21_009358 [Puccinia graminis f. sp. tritici]|uniref:Glycoside hydrolase 131 catalytic N-terminal domain-containing protein n=1 Tax=Puccinia graminis f. sp. tritici TaxID=56615 RepID=A0A5B0QW27_PUCGR|nr:hypothetical protein PGTUg99_001303 [Puccinia graminis f. sp. tritici]KAA1117497.1 hypothetical protein PGT21_009358 [Puccinia graminis f. sp. tritici]KAA1118511.1 hypothetical protein PGTUg99_000630 [Puccinia graminis f. sp. tritici]